MERPGPGPDPRPAAHRRLGLLRGRRQPHRRHPCAPPAAQARPGVRPHRDGHRRRLPDARLGTRGGEAPAAAPRRRRGPGDVRGLRQGGSPPAAHRRRTQEDAQDRRCPRPAPAGPRPDRDQSLRPDARLAEILARACPERPVVSELAELAPAGSPAALLKFLQAQKSLPLVACVGHEPNLSQFAGWLLTGGEKSFLELRKGGACLLDFAGRVAPGNATLLWHSDSRPAAVAPADEDSGRPAGASGGGGRTPPRARAARTRRGSPQALVEGDEKRRCTTSGSRCGACEASCARIAPPSASSSEEAIRRLAAMAATPTRVATPRSSSRGSPASPKSSSPPSGPATASWRASSRHAATRAIARSSARSCATSPVSPRSSEHASSPTRSPSTSNTHHDRRASPPRRAKPWP